MSRWGADRRGPRLIALFRGPSNGTKNKFALKPKSGWRIDLAQGVFGIFAVIKNMQRNCPNSLYISFVIGVSALGLVSAGTELSPAQSSSNLQSVFSPLPDSPKIDEKRAKLGAVLFFDNRLSGDTGNSCAACHDPTKGWTDGRPLSAGYTGTEYFRNTPSLFNSFARKRLMWDARLDGADSGTLVRDMITEAHTMNADTRIVQERLKQVPEYADKFKSAFGGDPYGGMIYGAIAEFLKTIRTANAPFDKFLRGNSAALTERQKFGMELFKGKAGCATCHNGALLSDHKPHAIGVPEHPDMARNAERQITMLRHYATFGVPNFMSLRADVGYYVVTKDEKDIGKFLTPSLWDVGQTGPYMHNGTFATLEAVVEFYDRGGGESPNKSTAIKSLNLTVDEKQALVEFLRSLTGERPKTTPPKLPEYGMRPLGTN